MRKARARTPGLFVMPRMLSLQQFAITARLLYEKFTHSVLTASATGLRFGSPEALGVEESLLSAPFFMAREPVA